MEQKNTYKKKKKSIFLIFILTLIVVFVLVGGGALYYNHLIAPADLTGEEKIIEIPQGYSVRSIANLLQEEDIIRKDLAFLIAVRLGGLQSQLQSGKYLLSPSMSTKEIIIRLAGGQVIDDRIKVTIPEGFDIKMIAQRLEEKGLTTKDKFIQVAQDIEKFNFLFLQDIPKERKDPLEGYLFPETYHFSIDTSEEQMINTMLDRFNNIFNNEYIERAKELDMSIDDIVILSSIIEQETKFEMDRPGVAGVFYNRLKVGMPLQSDVTVLYALGEKKEQVLFKDLKIDSKYNTYKYPGLPIGPIGSFGESSLNAVLYPENNDYLYFIAKSDGYCVFNTTYDEHMEDVRKHLR